MLSAHVLQMQMNVIASVVLNRPQSLADLYNLISDVLIMSQSEDKKLCIIKGGNFAARRL